MNPKISLIIPTMRVGGLDILTHGLKGQNFRDFELVLVDGIHDLRIGIFDDKSLDFPITHIAPRENPFPLNSFCQYSNTGLVHARGDLVLFATDYTWFPPDCIEKHIIFHEALGRGHGLMCPHRYITLPSLNPKFIPYKPFSTDEAEKYAQDVRSMPPELMWSILLTEFNSEADKMPHEEIPSGHIFYGHDPKLFLPPGPVVPSMFHGKNESCRLENVLDVNGWDEDLDGTHGYQDSDLADRLTTKMGLQWTLDPGNIAYIVNPRSVFPFARRTREITTNEAIWNSKRLAGYPDMPNSWSLLQARLELG
jgi:glycosyltransferase involved in cell wall biosynthesis